MGSVLLLVLTIDTLRAPYDIMKPTTAMFLGLVALSAAAPAPGGKGGGKRGGGSYIIVQPVYLPKPQFVGAATVDMEVDTEVVSEVDTVVDTVVDTPPVDTVWVVDTPAWEATEAGKAGNYQSPGPASCYFM